MHTAGYSFPHPVLGNADDVQGSLKVKMRVDRNESRMIEFSNIQIENTNGYIAGLIAAGQANYFVRIYCSATMSTWLLEYRNANIQVSENDLVAKAEVQVYIISKVQISNYSDASFNSQFAGTVFEVAANEVLGISGKLNVPIEKINERLGLGNIFKFFQQESGKPINFEFTRDKIYINYPVTKKGEHPPRAMFEKRPWTAFQIFIVPAIAEALRYVDDNNEKVKNLEWYQVIDSILPESERDGNYFSQAQTLLNKGLPILLSHDELMK
jgi:hypothetical protein